MRDTHLYDIHSHILPGVDDGAEDISQAVALLEMMKQQGITDVIATPHFDAGRDTLEDYFLRVKTAYDTLKAQAASLSLPNILLGSEVFFFSGIGKSAGIRSLGLCGSNYLLLELPEYPISDRIIDEIVSINNHLGMIPVIAHIERMSDQRGFKKLLRLIDNRLAYAQVNCSSILQPPYKKTVFRLIRKGYISFIATDAHSVKERPPLMKQALDELELVLGAKAKNIFIANSDKFYRETTVPPAQDFELSF